MLQTHRVAHWQLLLKKTFSLQRKYTLWPHILSSLRSAASCPAGPTRGDTLGAAHAPGTSRLALPGVCSVHTHSGQGTHSDTTRRTQSRMAIRRYLGPRHALP